MLTARELFSTYDYSRNTNLQGYEHGYHNIEDEVLNDPMDEDDVIDTNDEYEINKFIQYTFAPLDEDNLHDIHDVPLLEKSQEPLYEGSTKNILSTLLLLVNLKVLNGLSDTCFTQILRYAIINCIFTWYGKFNIFLYF